MLTLDHLTIEIKNYIIRDVPNIKSLCSLIRASPDMYAVYAYAQRHIFTRVTLNELIERGIDVLTPASLLQVKALGGVDVTLRSALQSLHHQLTAMEDPVVLDIEQCKSLRQLEDVILWDVKRSDEKSVKPRYINMPGTESGYWQSYRSYKMVWLGKPVEWDMRMIDAVCLVNTNQAYFLRCLLEMEGLFT